MKNALIVEDDIHIAGLLEMHLKDNHYLTSCAGNGEEAIRLATENTYDIIILDVMLPDIDGIEVCRILRNNKINFPVLILTARSEEIDKIIGLEAGADDYLTKPFSIRELLARVKALVRRTERKQEGEKNLPETITFDTLSVDLSRRKVLLDNKKVELTPKEFDLLALFITHPGKSYSRQALLSRIWGSEYKGYEHTVNAHINRLRSKIEPDLAHPRFILTTWGVGYRFNDEWT